jgi:hypothetical protein
VARELRFRHRPFAMAAVIALSICASATEASAQYFWVGWGAHSSGAIVQGGPAAAYFGGMVHLFARGMDSHVYEATLSSGWTEVPSGGSGIVTSDPGAAEFAGNLYLFVRGTDSTVYQNVQSGGAWSGWSLVVGTVNFIGDPAFVQEPGVLDLAATGSDSHAYINGYLQITS